jgi:hypothetical protein
MKSLMHLRYSPSGGGRGLFSFFYTRVRILLYMFVIPVVPYMFIGFAGYLMDREINRDARKLTRTSK